MQVLVYIDPNTMHHVFTFFGSVLAIFAAGLSLVISAVFLFRYRIVTCLAKASRFKLMIICFVVISILVTAVSVIVKWVF